jgi:hypothetical protein
MDHYSFQGPYAYRWVDDVPVERIRLSDGERRVMRIGERHQPAPPAASTARSGMKPAVSPAVLSALMAAWN